jgi:hypothetical protein
MVRSYVFLVVPFDKPNAATSAFLLVRNVAATGKDQNVGLAIYGEQPSHLTRRCSDMSLLQWLISTPTEHGSARS